MRATAIAILGVIFLSGLLWASSVVVAQPTQALRLAILDDASDKARADDWKVFRARLRDHGYAEGRNLLVETRYAQGNSQRLPAMATDLVAWKPHVIVAPSTPATQAVMKATSTIPIVFLAVGDPVGAGIIASFARPGKNATGLSVITGELGAKWIELMREIAPGAKRLAYLTDTSNQGSMLVYKRVQEAAGKLNVTVEAFAGQQGAELTRSLEAIAQQRFGGLIVGNPSVMLDYRERIVQFAARQRLPAVYARREYANAGGLISYSVDHKFTYERAADYVQRIAQGAKASELPVERPSTLRMVLNLKTSRASGINIPESIRHRADELID